MPLDTAGVTGEFSLIVGDAPLGPERESLADSIEPGIDTGATIGDATTFDIELYNNAVGALHDADVNYGGTTTAMTGDAATKTVQEVSLTALVANFGTPGEPVTIGVKPTAGLLGTDDVIIHSIRLQYKRKPATS